LQHPFVQAHARTRQCRMPLLRQPNATLYALAAFSHFGRSESGERALIVDMTAAAGD